MALAILFMFILGAGTVVGAYFGVAKLPGMLAQRKLENRLDEVIRPVDADQPQAGLVKTDRKSVV